MAYFRTYQQSKYQNLSFEGLRENKILGEKVLKGFRREFQRPHSNTFVNAKIMQYEKIPHFQDTIKKVLNVSQRNSDAVGNLRKILEGNYPTLADYANKTKEVVRTTKAGNCGECSIIIQHELLQQGEKAHNIAFFIRESSTNLYRKNHDHIFTVFGLKKGAELINPKTWGNEAVIVDAWTGIVKQAHDALNYLKTFMCFDSSKHTIEYKCLDKVPII